MLSHLRAFQRCCCETGMRPHDSPTRIVGLSTNNWQHSTLFDLKWCAAKCEQAEKAPKPSLNNEVVRARAWHCTGQISSGFARSNPQCRSLRSAMSMIGKVKNMDYSALNTALPVPPTQHHGNIAKHSHLHRRMHDERAGTDVSGLSRRGLRRLYR